MRNKMFLALFTISFSSLWLNSQTLKNDSSEQSIFQTAKVWGFLKYYHPNVNQLNWDKELKTALGLNSTDSSLTYLINQVKINPYLNINSQVDTDSSIEYFYKNLNLEWINTLNTSLENRLYLKDLINIQDTSKKKYATYNQIKTFKAINEDSLLGSNFNNEEEKMLLLIRYWNIIEYFFPYKYQMDKNWDIVLAEMIPKFNNAKTKHQLHVLFLELVANLNDSHAYFYSDETSRFLGSKIPPFGFKIIQNEAVITRLYDSVLFVKSNLKIGDRITSIEAVSLENKLDYLSNYVSFSNEAILYRKSQFRLFNGLSDSLNISLIRGNDTINQVIYRGYYSQFKNKEIYQDKYYQINDSIAYINLGEIEKEEVKSILKKLKHNTDLILDIRNYPKGVMFELTNYLLKSEVPFAKFTTPDLSMPGRYYWTKPYYCGKKTNFIYKGKIICLINEETQSHAEFTAMSLKTVPGAIFIGNQTSGADGNVNSCYALDGLKTYFTGLGVYYPNGKITQRVGIESDYLIEYKLSDILSGLDPILEKAIEVAKKN